ncbi:MAG: cysteine desulfurase family protein, partial [Planctomycetaceae bacterium]
IINAAEHRAVLDPAKRLKQEGVVVTILPVDEYGRVDQQAVEDAIRPETSLVSVMMANNEVGTLNAVEKIGTVCQRKGVLFHSDASQAIGKLPVKVSELPIDLMSFTAHKIYGPQGVGALYIRRRQPAIRLVSQIDGGGHERRLRSGTLPVPLIVGFGEACQIAVGEMEEESTRLRNLRERLRAAIMSALDGVTLNGHPDLRLPGNLHLSFAGVDGDALMANLDGLAVSSGSACTTADPEPSHVLRAMGIPEKLSLASLRFGLGRLTTTDEIDRAAQLVISAVQRLRDMKSCSVDHHST